MLTPCMGVLFEIRRVHTKLLYETSESLDKVNQTIKSNLILVYSLCLHFFTKLNIVSIT